MNNSKIVFLINDDVRAVKCEYEPDGSTTIYKTFDPDIAVDNFVVVPTTTRHEMTVVKVTEVDVDIDFDNGPDIKWIMDVVNLEKHKEVLRNEQTAIRAVQHAERDRKRRELRDAMFQNHEEQLKTLSIAKVSDDEEVTE